jgi:hypothetical protein
MSQKPLAPSTPGWIPITWPAEACRCYRLLTELREALLIPLYRQPKAWNLGKLKDTLGDEEYRRRMLQAEELLQLGKKNDWGLKEWRNLARSAWLNSNDLDVLFWLYFSEGRLEADKAQAIEQAEQILKDFRK